ncbi:MAG: sel1 repeat family protein [Bacteroidales bacterium]|nr:sel1 repeat family protein [Bacteroidales bacterium]
MKTILSLITLMLFCLTINAQNAKEIYSEGKALYEAKKYKEAFVKFQTAANAGNKKAQYYLGRCYDKGRGVTEDDSKAFVWYQKSADQDYAKAQYQLGKCYKKGEGTEKNVSKAAEYFLKAATQGNADAQFELGKCYLKGKGVEQDSLKAKDLFFQAVNNPKGGEQILKELKKESSEGDTDAAKILKMIKK